MILHVVSSSNIGYSMSGARRMSGMASAALVWAQRQSRRVAQRVQRGERRVVGWDMAVADQEVHDDEARVGGHVVAGEDREQGVRRTQAMLHRLAVLIRRHELGGQPQI